MALGWRALLLMITCVGCTDARVRAHKRVDAGATSAPAAAPPVLQHGLSWYEDQPQVAFAEARAQQKLVLVDLWAPWCHTCLSMREYVLTANNLAGLHEQLVFLAINTEHKQNAALLRALPVAAWPTLYVVAADQTIYGRWVGAASPVQLAAFVRDALKAHAARGTEARGADAPLALLLQADRAVAREQLAEARDLYRRALARAPANWSRRPDALVSLASTLRKLEQARDCVALGLKALDQTGASASATDFSYHVLDCAKQLDSKDRRVAALRNLVEERLTTLCNEGSPALTPDDRGDACGLLRDVREQLGDRAGAHAALATRLRALEEAADGVPDRIALTYDSARVDSLLGLGRGEEAIALMEAREAAVSDDYNPPHLLARAYGELGRFDEGLGALDRALAKADAPRRASLLGLKVELLLGAGQKAEARRTLEQQLVEYRGLPPGQHQSAREQKVAERLARWK